MTDQDTDIHAYMELEKEFAEKYKAHKDAFRKLNEMDKALTNKYTDTICQYILKNNGKLQFSDIAEHFKNDIPASIITIVIKNLRNEGKLFMTYASEFILDDAITNKQKEIDDMRKALNKLEDELDKLDCKYM